MTTSYDETLPTDRDWVRFQVYDRTAPFILQDEEIDFFLDSETNKWLAAAAVGDVILARSKGVIAKKVAETTTAYGIAGSVLASASSYQEHMNRLRKIGFKKSLERDGASGFLRVI